MFDCGIHVINGEINTVIEDGIVKAVRSVGFVIDKEQLLKAITEARTFYEQGVSDGRMKAREDLIVRCGMCKYHGTDDCAITRNEGYTTSYNWFCGDGKRKDSDPDD